MLRPSFVFVCVFAVATCGLVYELLCGAVASYLLGSSITQYSLIIGLFLSAMGIGSYLTRFITQDYLDKLIFLQVLLGLTGGFSAQLLFFSFGLNNAIEPVLYGITLAIGAIVGAEIPLLIRLLPKNRSLDQTIAQVFAWDYCGAFLASVSFPFVILPFLGLVRAGLFFGLVNIAVAAFLLLKLPGQLTAPKRLKLTVATAAAVLLLAFVGSSVSTTFLEDQIYPDEIILNKTSPYQKIVVTRWQSDYRLFLNGQLQFSSVDEHRYHESLLFPPLAVLQKTAPERELKVLILGGGDGLAARTLLKNTAIKHITIVDLDPTLTNLFKEHPLMQTLNNHSLGDPKVSVVNADAFHFLRTSDFDRFDLIVADLPDPSTKSLAKLYSTAFYRLALERLAPDGVFVTQATSPFYARESFWSIYETLRSVAESITGPTRVTTPYHAHVPSFGDWGFSMVTLRLDLQNLDTVPSGRFINPETFAGLFSFPQDVESPPDIQTNTLANPVVAWYHSKGWARYNQ